MKRNVLKADPKEVETIIKMEWPAYVSAVQRFIGLVKYLSKFLQELSELCEPLHCITHKKAEWNWTHEQKKMPLRGLKMLFPKRQCSSTAVRVTQPKAKGMHLKMDLVL